MFAQPAIEEFAKEPRVEASGCFGGDYIPASLNIQAAAWILTARDVRQAGSQWHLHKFETPVFIGFFPSPAIHRWGGEKLIAFSPVHRAFSMALAGNAANSLKPRGKSGEPP